jgi:hypothetical protein
VADKHVVLLDAVLNDTSAAAERAMHHHVVVDEMVAMSREQPSAGDKAGRQENSEDHGVHR